MNAIFHLKKKRLIYLGFFPLWFSVDGFSLDSEADLKISRDVKDLQGSQGCEEIGREQCNPGYSKVRTSGPRPPPRPHPRTGKLLAIPFLVPSVRYG